MAIYKCGRGDETWSAVKQLQIAVRTGLELGTSGFQDRRPNHSATLGSIGYQGEGMKSSISCPDDLDHHDATTREAHDFSEFSKMALANLFFVLPRLSAVLFFFLE